MQDQERELTIDELAERVGVSVRTVRFYISEGLLPGPGARGKAASYGEEHLLRLRLVRLLAEQRVPLAEVRTRLAPLSIAEVRSLLAEEGRAAAERAEAARQPSPRAYIQALLRQAQGAHFASPTRLHASAATLRERACPVFETPPPPAGAEPWQRWELAPGVELHVRVDAASEERELVERILRAAGWHRQESRGGTP